MKVLLWILKVLATMLYASGCTCATYRQSADNAYDDDQVTHVAAPPKLALPK
jgi:hypothetical protein